MRTLAAVAEALEADVQITFRPRSGAAAAAAWGGTEPAAAKSAGLSVGH